MSRLIRIHPSDNVAVAVEPVMAGEGCCDVIASEPIAKGFKMALDTIAAGDPVIKYGNPIGIASQPILPGTLVHVHNLSTALSGEIDYAYQPTEVDSLPLPDPKAKVPMTFDGYVRPDGRAATRNEIWIIPTVSCVNGTIQRLAKAAQSLVTEGIDDIIAYPHPYGCSQLGEDHEMTQRILADLVDHPNAAGVLVVGLGCENNQVADFKQVLGDYDPDRVRFLICQDVEDEYTEGMRHLEALVERAKAFRRQPVPLSGLVVGMKCGGSDGLSGITANPLVGAFSDRLIALGGTTILTEVPEMFGAETILMNRSKDTAVFEKTVRMINDFKQYYIDHGQTIYENPSPGNKAGGISTLEDKSLGCIQKGGSAQVSDVLPYGGRVVTNGLNLLSGPGNDVISITTLTAAGANLVVFTTGRGTPLGAPAPTVKISSNTALFERKRAWTDFDAGPIANGRSLDEMADALLSFVVDVASGKIRTCSERNDLREIAIFKDGVIL